MILFLVGIIEAIPRLPNGFEDLLRENDIDIESAFGPLAKRASERKEGNVVFGKMPAFVKGTGIGREIIHEESEKPSRFARKNCFFSPVQCSFYYKRNAVV
ncbi:hypothetical protein FO519_002749 [Halicephalobus sp. NKZ332]|nr:hypothetical protein FO519_002749 [Halicephalobus sp. NKZ332]